jgi:hypothetical protein
MTGRISRTDGTRATATRDAATSRAKSVSSSRAPTRMSSTGYGGISHAFTLDDYGKAMEMFRNGEGRKVQMQQNATVSNEF